MKFGTNALPTLCRKYDRECSLLKKTTYSIGKLNFSHLNKNELPIYQFDNKKKVL